MWLWCDVDAAAPAHEHHVMVLHKHGHHFGGLPMLFWGTIGLLITVFHLFLFKLIYNEYCSGSESTCPHHYPRHSGRYVWHLFFSLSEQHRCCQLYIVSKVVVCTCINEQLLALIELTLTYLKPILDSVMYCATVYSAVFDATCLHWNSCRWIVDDSSMYIMCVWCVCYNLSTKCNLWLLRVAEKKFFIH